jgi:uncharacterized protein (DUF924 family)
MMDPRAQEVLEFWFGGGSNTAESLGARNKLWFGAKPETDELIRRRFEPLLTLAAEGKLAGWRGEKASCLALVVLLDQFSLNLYRGQARSFLWNAAALPYALHALDQGWDKECRLEERVFLYLPLEHAEDPVLQRRSVALFRQLAGEAPRELKSEFDRYLDYAIRHEEVVRRFGRFPNRNRALERPDTAEEARYMATGGTPF